MQDEQLLQQGTSACNDGHKSHNGVGAAVGRGLLAAAAAGGAGRTTYGRWFGGGWSVVAIEGFSVAGVCATMCGGSGGEVEWPFCCRTSYTLLCSVVGPMVVAEYYSVSRDGGDGGECVESALAVFFVCHTHEHARAHADVGSLDVRRRRQHKVRGILCCGSAALPDRTAGRGQTRMFVSSVRVCVCV